MVTKKYLCNAPRQEVWDEKVEAMLKSLRGSEKQKRKYIRKTLQGLQEEHGHEKRSGPGRKSNAYYALTYFEYALSKVGGSMDDSDSASSGSSSSSDESEGSNNKRKHETEEEKTIESMDSVEFLNEHNDLCDVCNEGGELLCCSTCNLVFHLGCIRPAMEELPQGDWSCPYCILSGTPVAIPGKRHKQTVKRNSKMWKAAAIGVRQMGRLRALANNNNNKEKESSKTTSDGTATETPSKKMTEDASQGNKTPPDLTITPPLRGKRSRRQVTLYDPQEGPASEWRSDEKYGMDGYENKEEGSNPAVEPMARKRRRMARKKQQEEEEKGEVHSSQEEDDNDSTASAFCKFCKDDKNIPLCVFCGCRVCFGKKDKQKLLLCDGCDEEYHTYCLDPPLASAPKASASWYCPSCTKERTITRVHKTRRSSSVTKASSSPPPPPTTPKSSSKPTGRPRGRPPKNPSSSATTPTPKRRGRPPKSATKAQAETPAPRKRGRPPKNASSTPASESLKRKQSPSSSGGTSTTTSNTSKKARTALSSPITAARKVTTLPSAAVESVTSRSGRVIKATSKQQARAEQLQAHNKITTETANTATTRASTSSTRASESAATKKTTPVMPTPKQSSRTHTKQTTSAKKPTIPSAAKKPMNTTTSTTGTVTPTVATTAPTKIVPAATVPSAKPPTVAGKTAKPAVSTVEGTKKPSVGSQDAAAATKKVAAIVPNPAATASGSALSKVVPAPAASTVKTATNKSSTTAAAAPAKKPSTPSTTSKKVPTISVTTREPQGKLEIPVAPIVAAVKKVAAANPRAKLDVPSLVAKAIRQSAAAARADVEEEEKPQPQPAKAPRRKPGARECMQISRRFGLRVIPQKYMETLLDYCTRGKVEHLIRMRERLDEHSRFLEAQLAGLEAVIRDVGESDVVVPALPDRPDNKPHSAPAPR